MWNLVKTDKNDILLVSSEIVEVDWMEVVVCKNYECIFHEKIKSTDINARFEFLNEGIEIEEEVLIKSIVDALNNSSTSFEISFNSSQDALELNIMFDISNIQLKWTNSCKLTDSTKMLELFTQPLLSYTSLLLLHNKTLLSALKEKDCIIDQYKDIQIPTIKKIKKNNKKTPEDIDLLLNCKEFEEILSDECCGVFSKESCKLMQNISNQKHLLNNFKKHSSSTNVNKADNVIENTSVDNVIENTSVDKKNDDNDKEGVNDDNDKDAVNDDKDAVNDDDDIKASNNSNMSSNKTKDDTNVIKMTNMTAKRRLDDTQGFEQQTDHTHNEKKKKPKKMTDEKKKKIKKLKF